MTALMVTMRYSDSPPFRRVLVANRGEIAVRICRGLRELGVEPIAVHSDGDRDSGHVLEADVVAPLGGETASESYLDSQKIIDAALATGAEAVHPGYGFLSENADFARAVRDAGMVFIGADPRAMERLGFKKRAREVAIEAGVPVIPGVQGDRGDDEFLQREAERIGFPIMVKASAGGGGKGMRIVTDPRELGAALAAGRREALAAFGNDHMILEKVVAPARHVEIQIIGDRDGKVISLHERECSVQRRHQKVLEESPSPVVGDELRREMGAAAVRLAEFVGYHNAGTVEFLLDAQDNFYFLEVNTRLQVEHPVTELVTGVDLVHLQVLIAAGKSLDELLGDHDSWPRGHAMEARIYAEDPDQGFLPAAGTLSHVVEPEGPGVRVDSGVYPGCEVSMFFDPLLAKLIVHGPDRRTVCARMARALKESVYLGIPTNIDFLHRVVAHPAFLAGDLRTDFLDQHPELVAPPEDSPGDEVFVAAAVAEALTPRRGIAGAARSGGRAPSPWETQQGLRLWEVQP